MVSSVACQALVSLVDNGLLEIAPTLTKFIATLGETKNYLAVTSAINNLLILDLKVRNFNEDYTCPYSIKAPQHPLITVLTQKSDAWRDILGHMQSMLHQCKPECIKDNVELLRPVFMYILCDPHMTLPESCRHQTWHCLIKTNGTLNLQLEVLQWLLTNNVNSCINANNFFGQLIEIAIVKNDKQLCTALAALIMAGALNLLIYNSDPTLNINMLESILDLTDKSLGSLLLALLAEILRITPSIYLAHLLKLGVKIFFKLNCNKVIAYTLVASILPWMAYSNSLSNDALDIGKELIDTIIINDYTENRDKMENSLLPIVVHADSTLAFYLPLCACVDTTNDNIINWLKRLTEIPLNFLYDYKIILGGVFLYSKNSKITIEAGKLLLLITKHNTKFAGHVLSLLLYRLTSAYDVDETKELLFILPELATSKENVPIIVQSLQTMIDSGEPLKYLAINLYLKAWMVEPRCHRHLLTALIDMSKNDKTFKGNTTCAKAMKFICENRPEHGAELVPLLSQTLNRCKDTSGSAACALALRGISALCLSGIADVCSTWTVLAPKMNIEERVIVIKSMCKFFGDIPSNPAHPEEEFDKLVSDVLTKLWKYALYETTREIEVVEAAFQALASYTINKMNLIELPEQFKSNLSVPQKYAGDKTQEIKPEDVLTYIPGDCWITMLEKVYEPTRNYAGDLIIKFITDELYTFRSGIYMWPMGEPINFKYLPEKSPARAIGEYIRRFKSPSTVEQQNILIECLRIFSHKYIKALPPVKWEVLTAINTNKQTFNYGISLACHQAAVSPTAKEYLGNYVGKMTGECTKEFDKCWQLCTHLEDLCRGVSTNILGPFLESTINYLTERAIVDEENSATLFNELMERFERSLQDDLVHADSKSLMIKILEKLINKIDVDNKIFTGLVKAMMGIPTDIIEKITLPSAWQKIDCERLKKVIVIRAGLVLKRDNEVPMSWMNEIIRVAANETG